ncbi:hypothetical protein FACHB389_09970 [Nostoc calcicola FACHB-389]|nr:calcium-binding protein [Nostoc calcicola FACHB-3891]OKH37447.1 hypothetical protein FACHB389_09970 [Nostoc calcicola FACHB-389]
MANIIGTDGNDTLQGSNIGDIIDGKAGNDIILFNYDNQTLTGGGGKDEFVYDYGNNNIIITDFGGVGKGTNPTAEVITEVDILSFEGFDLTPQNMLLTQNGNNLEITFKAEVSPKVILQNFALENLDNFSKSTGGSVDLGNILFAGQNSITDSFDVFNADSTQSTIFNKNTVTFLNDLDNNVSGFDNSDDVINGQGGDDIIDGKSGNDLLRGGTGNNTLIGGAGDDLFDVVFSTGDNILNGDAGDDRVIAAATKGNNFLSGGEGNDYLYTSYNSTNGYTASNSSGNNTLIGGAGNDTLNAESPEGDNFLSGDDGNDYLSSSGIDGYRAYFSFSSSGNNTLNGGAGDDTLRAEFSTGNNLLSGGDGNDSLSISGYLIDYIGQTIYDSSSGDNTLNGGAGDDTLRAEYTTGNNLLSGGDGNDSFYLRTSPPHTAPSFIATQTVDGGQGDDLLSVNYSYATAGIVSTFNPTTNSGEITAGTYRVSYKDIEGLNILDTAYDDSIVGSNGNDTLSGVYGGKDTIDGGLGDDVLSVNNYGYSNGTGGITSTFNAITNTGSITNGTNQVSYKNIERLNIFGTGNNDNIVGNSGNDTLSPGYGGKDTIDGGLGDDVLSVNYGNATGGITWTFNTNTNVGEINAGANRVTYKNIERFNISGTNYDEKIVGKSGNDTLSGASGNDTIIGGAGNDIIIGGGGNDTLTGGLGNDTFVYDILNDYLGSGTDIITDFGSVGKGSNPSAGAIASLDTLQFKGSSTFSAQNLQLTQNGNNLEITFEGVGSTKVILQNTLLENLDNLSATSSRPAIGNILFDGQTSISDSFDVFDANSTQTSLFNKNTVTFLNDLDNNIIGFDNSNDVINGQGGDDIIDGKSGNDLLRGGAGNDFLLGGVGNDTLLGPTGNDTLDGGSGDDSLNASASTGDNLLDGGDGNDSLDIYGSYETDPYSDSDSDSRSLGNNTLNGGAGNDSLYAGGSKGNNLLSGGDGNDRLDISGEDAYDGYNDYKNSRSEGNNTLEGGAGDDLLKAEGSTGDNLLSGGDGNDQLDISGDYSYYNDYDYNDSRSKGNNTLEGGAGNDYLFVSGSTGDNLLFGDDGNDYIFAYGASGNNTLYGGNGNDTLGGNGNDSLYGGDGTDTFAFGSYNQGVVTISDFNAANELIEVSTYGFGGGLSKPSLLASQFTIGTSATTSTQRFIYDNTTGALFFDQDGNASAFTQVKFAQLSAGVILNENNFVVV